MKPVENEERTLSLAESMAMTYRHNVCSNMEKNGSKYKRGHWREVHICQEQIQHSGKVMAAFSTSCTSATYH